VNIVVLLVIMALAVLTGVLLWAESWRAARGRLEFDVRAQNDEHPKRLRRIK